MKTGPFIFSIELSLSDDQLTRARGGDERRMAILCCFLQWEYYTKPLFEVAED